MTIKYQFFEEESLLIQKFYGSFSFEFYMNNIMQVHESLKSKMVKKVLLDFRDIEFEKDYTHLPADFDIKIEKIVNFRKEFNQNRLPGKKTMVVIWVDKPLPTVIVHLFIKSSSNSNYQYCSSEEKVIQIMEINPEFNLSVKTNNLIYSVPESGNNLNQKV